MIWYWSLIHGWLLIRSIFCHYSLIDTLYIRYYWSYYWLASIDISRYWYAIIHFSLVYCIADIDFIDIDDYTIFHFSFLLLLLILFSYWWLDCWCLCIILHCISIFSPLSFRQISLLAFIRYILDDDIIDIFDYWFNISHFDATYWHLLID